MLERIMAWTRERMNSRRLIPLPLWKHTLSSYPFLAQLTPDEQSRLRLLCQLFLGVKEFTAANGLQLTDEITVAISAQACLPILNMGAAHQMIHWYDDFVGIVVHPTGMVARRERMDAAGVVHAYSEVLSGEAMTGGPVTLSWQDVRAGADRTEAGHNVVIHEFTHKLDMRDGEANGCPPLWPDFMDAGSARQARIIWMTVLQKEFLNFREQVIQAERFGRPAPWMDSYGATSAVEFFAVASEAYHVNRLRFSEEFPEMRTLFDAFFQSGQTSR